MSSAAENPKHSRGLSKQPFRHVPPAAIAAMARVMAGGPGKGGAFEYGAFNWGEAGIVATVYEEAILRHLFEWFTCGSVDRKSGENHMAHIMATAAIVLDCEMSGLMEDDRPIGKTTPCVFSAPKEEDSASGND